MNRRPRVLLIDDDLGLQRAMARLAEQERIDILPAYLGAEALPLAMAHRPDVIVLDMTLPDIEGAEVLAQLKRHPALATIPIIVWSARDYESCRLIALAGGADDYVDKARAIEIIDKIQSLVRTPTATAG